MIAEMTVFVTFVCRNRRPRNTPGLQLVDNLQREEREDVGVRLRFAV
jgi:hypothetical protein